MNLKTLINQFLFPALIAGVGTLVISCSSDDVINVPTASEEKPFIGVAYIEDSISIRLQLLNSDSVATDTFKEGENITFKLTIENISSKWVVTNPIEKFSDNIFNIYSSNGTDLGKPWDGRAIILIPSYLIPDMVLEHVCSWLDEPVENMDEADLDSKLSVTRPVLYLKQERRQSLPKGSYYTQFEVSIIEGKTLTIRMNFNVV